MCLHTYFRVIIVDHKYLYIKLVNVHQYIFINLYFIILVNYYLKIIILT